ncbi:hypothetical protein NLI96_g9906 [Meripilus lineatus]|uniref:Magnesium-dependent phosphatase-1 n=1 Tax=Meripilus lineatus TaxID=2056292 RepID=A0AAD5UUL7_9APHY|nr:hypothetical protein NLI96_g9906 [Physisporinus lineatus]
MTGRLPKLIAFDLDYTLWGLWIDTHAAGPLRREGDTLNAVKDKYGEKIAFYHDVAEILHRLRAGGVIIAACSRTHTPALAREALGLLLVPPPAGHKNSAPTPAIQFFDQHEIYPGEWTPYKTSSSGAFSFTSFQVQRLLISRSSIRRREYRIPKW